MLKRCILAENRKLHASPIWAMFFVLPILSATYGTFNYLQNLEILTDGWYSLWTQHTLFYSMLFFPAMVATYTVCRHGWSVQDFRSLGSLQGEHVPSHGNGRRVLRTASHELPSPHDDLR